MSHDVFYKKGQDMKKIFIVCLSLLICVIIGIVFVVKINFFTNNANDFHIYTAKEQNEINASDRVEFIYSEQEQKATARWKNQTMDDLVRDAHNGDRAALYNLGEYSLLGLGDMMMNAQFANYYFAKSASLGFAPALNNIIQMYIHEQANVYLGLIYINLIISFGHTEFIQIYHNFRKAILANSVEKGQNILNEIERIAMHKKIIILKNQRLIQAEQTLLNNITEEDYQYDDDYWLDVYNGDNELLDFSKIKECDRVYLDRLHTIYYQTIVSNVDCNDEQNLLDNAASEVLKVIDEMEKKLYSEAEIEKLNKQARMQAKKNYKLVSKIESNAKKAEKNLKVLEEYQDFLEKNKN